MTTVVTNEKQTISTILYFCAAKRLAFEDLNRYIASALEIRDILDTIILNLNEAFKGRYQHLDFTVIGICPDKILPKNVSRSTKLFPLQKSQKKTFLLGIIFMKLDLQALQRQCEMVDWASQCQPRSQETGSILSSAILLLCDLEQVISSLSFLGHIFGGCTEG